MSWLLDLRLIPLFSFYLALFFCVSTYVRLRQYRVILALVARFPARWPNLLVLVRRHSHIFVTWANVLPMALVLLLLVLNTLASQVIWPTADSFRLGDLRQVWPVIPVIVLTGLATVLFDAYGLWGIGTIEQAELEKYFDQAEYWLRGWKAPMVRVFTLGFINPRQMVDTEVRNALVNTSALLNTTLWWVSVQTALRIAFGLSLWGTYAFQDWLRRLAGAL
jgi:hypothetical protein